MYTWIDNRTPAVLLREIERDIEREIEEESDVGRALLPLESSDHKQTKDRERKMKAGTDKKSRTINEIYPG